MRVNRYRTVISILIDPTDARSRLRKVAKFLSDLRKSPRGDSRTILAFYIQIAYLSLRKQRLQLDPLDDSVYFVKFGSARVERQSNERVSATFARKAPPLLDVVRPVVVERHRQLQIAVSAIIPGRCARGTRRAGISLNTHRLNARAARALIAFSAPDLSYPLSLLLPLFPLSLSRSFPPGSRYREKCSARCDLSAFHRVSLPPSLVVDFCSRNGNENTRRQVKQKRDGQGVQLQRGYLYLCFPVGCPHLPRPRLSVRFSVIAIYHVCISSRSQLIDAQSLSDQSGRRATHPAFYARGG